MTAIAGIWRFDGKPDASETCARMLAAQSVYGPHAEAQWSDGSIGLGWRQMCVLPEDAFDRQPLIGAGGRYVLVADIRLDNRDDLIRDLSLPSGQARATSDAALLLAVLEREGTRCLDRILGGYAIALWDRDKAQLTLARDGMGEKPLHFHHGKDVFAFSSMPRGLHSLPEVPRGARESRAALLLLQPLGNDSHSFFAGIDRVHTGHALDVTRNGLRKRRHWDLNRTSIRFGRPEEYVEAAREHLDRAVRCRLRGQGSVAAHLSGGLDSSGIAATAARLLSGSGRGVVAYTSVPRMGFETQEADRLSNRFFDEGAHAASVAALYANMEHVRMPNVPWRLPDYLDFAFSDCGEPLGGLSNSNWYFAINDEMRGRGLNLLLTGETGNYGLSYDGRTLLPELLRQGKFVQFLQAARALANASPVSFRTSLAWAIGPWIPASMWNFLNRLRGRGYQGFRTMSPLNPEYDLDAALHDENEPGIPLLDDRPEGDGFSFRRRVLTEGLDPGSFRKGVLARWQIDMRDPTADTRLLEFCLSVPSEFYLANGKARAFARAVLADRLPDMILNEQRQGLQSPDWHDHMTASRGDIGDELKRLEACPRAVKLLNIPRLRELLRNWDTEKDWAKKTIDYRGYLLDALSVGHFVRRADEMHA